MSAEQLRVRCPNCGRLVARFPAQAAPFFPFCSRRCKLVDLGKWFRGEHRIEGPPGEGTEGPSAGEDGE
jgi:endogenous inhibitor of DNA gyrase (YacG/DUF329 family)